MDKTNITRKSFGKRVRALRMLKDWTQDQLGQQTNLNSEIIRTYEAGRAYPKPEGFLALSSVFNVTVEWLLTGESKSPTVGEGKNDPVERVLSNTRDILQY